jgi:hypothetical protein
MARDIDGLTARHILAALKVGEFRADQAEHFG